MKHAAKSGFAILVGLLVLLTSVQVSFAAQGDTKAPSVTSLTLDKHLVSPGDTLTVTCKVSDSSEISTDPESDAKTFLVLQNEDYYTDAVYFQKQSSGVYTGTLTISDSYLNGYYFLRYFVISDVEGNSFQTTSYRDFPDMYFEVKNGASDKDIPVVKAMEISRNSAVPGDAVTVTIKVSDVNELDTDMASSFLYLNNDGYNCTPFVFTKKSEGIYTGTITVTDRFLNGRYRFGTMTLTDIVGNTLTIEDSSLFPDIYIDVSGASDDRNAPVVKSLEIDQHAVKAGDTVTVTGVITDESSIDNNYLSHYLLLRNGTFYSSPITFVKDGADRYTATVPITKEYVDGTYSLDYYVVSDVVGNRTIYRSPSDFPDIYLSVSKNPAPSYYHRPGWFQANEIWYFNDGNGQLVKGWLKSGNSWFYMDDAGEMKTGWVYSGGKWYYMDPVNGDMKTGWVQADGNWYYMDPGSGAMQTGWQRIGRNWYYLNASGAMATGWVNARGFWYYMDPGSGAMRTGWVQTGDSWYYMDPGSGVMQTGWLEHNGSWYYLKASGAMAVEWIQTGGKWYYMGPKGNMRTGWVKVGDSWYYFSSYGAMKTGWQRIGGTWYYLKASGAMAAGEWCGGYWLNRDGSWTYLPRGSWKADSVGWWYSDTSGWYAKNEKMKIDNELYDFDDSGYWIDPEKQEEEQT